MSRVTFEIMILNKKKLKKKLMSFLKSIRNHVQWNAFFSVIYSKS